MNHIEISYKLTLIHNYVRDLYKWEFEIRDIYHRIEYRNTPFFIPGINLQKIYLSCYPGYHFFITNKKKC